MFAFLPLVGTLACGGGGGGSTPTTPSPPATTPAAPAGPTTAAFGPYTFEFAAGTSTSDQQVIRDATQLAHEFLQATFGRTVQQTTTIAASTTAAGCSQGGSAAFTGSRTMTVCVANQGWTVHGPMNKQKIVVHEVFHLLQFEMRWLGNPATAGPHWLIEGAAEYVGWNGIATRNVVSFATVQGCIVKEVADFFQRQPPGLPNLPQLESPQSFTQTPGPLYPYAMIGIDELVRSAGIRSLVTYGDAVAGGTQWPTAFQSAFATSSATFYGQFPTYRAGLAVPAAYQCGG